jgi:hypothetical protein
VRGHDTASAADASIPVAVTSDALARSRAYRDRSSRVRKHARDRITWRCLLRKGFACPCVGDARRRHGVGAVGTGSGVLRVSMCTNIVHDCIHAADMGCSYCQRCMASCTTVQLHQRQVRSTLSHRRRAELVAAVQALKGAADSHRVLPRIQRLRTRKLQHVRRWWRRRGGPNPIAPEPVPATNSHRRLCLLSRLGGWSSHILPISPGYVKYHHYKRSHEQGRGRQQRRASGCWGG